MATKRKLELLTCGYINQWYDADKMIAMDIIRLIQLFYDCYFYWRVEGAEMKQAINANNGDILHCKSTFIIKDIEFECTLCPNGWKLDGIGNVQLYIEIKHIPSDIEWIRVFGEINCEITSVETTFMHQWNQSGNGYGSIMCKLTEFKSFKQIDFKCMVEILYIKYKQNANKINYFIPIEMKKSVQYEWKITDKGEMIKLRNMHKGMKKEFGRIDDIHNNWRYALLPRGFIRDSKFSNALAVNIRCIRIPFDVGFMNVKYWIHLETESGNFMADSGELIKHLIFANFRRSIFIGNRMCIECPDIDITKIFEEKWIKIKIKIDIVDVYDIQNQKVEQCEWSQYGIIN